MPIGWTRVTEVKFKWLRQMAIENGRLKVYRVDWIKSWDGEADVENWIIKRGGRFRFTLTKYENAVLTRRLNILQKQ